MSGWQRRSRAAGRVLALLVLVAGLGACQHQPPPVVARPVPPASLHQELAALIQPDGLPLAVWSAMPLTVHVGRALQLGLRTGENAFVSLYAVSSQGRVSRLMENRRFAAGRTQDFPSRASYRLSAPPGTETYVALAALEPLLLLGAADIVGPGDPLPLSWSPAQLAGRIQSVTAALPAGSWNVAVTDIDTLP